MHTVIGGSVFWSQQLKNAIMGEKLLYFHTGPILYGNLLVLYRSVKSPKIEIERIVITLWLGCKQ